MNLSIQVERNIRQNKNGTFFVVINRYAGRNASGQSISKMHTSGGSFASQHVSRQYVARKPV